MNEAGTNEGRTRWPNLRTLTPGVIGLWMVVLGGCYQYTPAPFETVSPEVHVRASLTSEKSLEVERTLGAFRSQVEGEVLERASDREAILLAVPRLQVGDQRTQSARLRQWLWIEERDVVRVEVRSLDRGKTGLVLGVATAAVGYLLHRALGAGSVDTDQPPTNGNDEA